MKLFAPFFTLTAYACYSKPRPQKPCLWDIGNWRLGTTSGSKIGSCPWLPCTELGNKTERENCVSKRPGTCSWIRQTHRCSDYEVDQSVYCQRRREVTALFDNYVKTTRTYNKGITTVIKIQQEIQIPNGRDCYYPTFGQFFNAYANCGGDMLKHPDKDSYCWDNEKIDLTLYD